jgi:hypothetical protein
MARYRNVFTSRRPRVTVSRISPDVMHRNAMMMRPVASTAVGIRGTLCVWMNVRARGIPRITAARAKTAARTVKKANGRSDRSSLAIVPTMRKPSPIVDSLLSEPSGRSR